MPTTNELARIASKIKQLGYAQGFQKTAIASIDLGEDEAHLERWLSLGRHGEMSYMQRHGRKRSRPAELVAGTVSVISARMDYWPTDATPPEEILGNPGKGYVARYALGRDYHKTLRGRLAKLADAVAELAGDFGYRVFVDSGPVLEKALARNGGLGWIGKHTNLLDRHAGSWFLLGEILTDLPLPPDAPVAAHCGSCRACIDACPTGAIVGPYELDARRCISYLTIELKGSIPKPLRAAIGNRIFGCDDCQLVCPWNRYARATTEPDFRPRHGLDQAELLELFAWSEETWRRRTEGSALRRTGYEAFLRNVAVALGNAPADPAIVATLSARLDGASEMLKEHISWALERQAA